MKNKNRLEHIVSRKKIIMLDFDGVIKDSNGAKLEAFIDLFPGINEKTKARIREHHLDNLGMSRYDKIPYYMKLASVKVSEESVNWFQKKFSETVIQRVLNANWVKGAYDFIKSHSCTHDQYIISATPKDELAFLIEKLEIKAYVKKAYGSPTKKVEAIEEVLEATKGNHCELLFIGDGSIDYESAQKMGIDFLLMQNDENHAMQRIIPLENQIRGFT